MRIQASFDLPQGTCRFSIVILLITDASARFNSFAIRPADGARASFQTIPMFMPDRTWRYCLTGFSDFAVSRCFRNVSISPEAYSPAASLILDAFMYSAISFW